MGSEDNWFVLISGTMNKDRVGAPNLYVSGVVWFEEEFGERLIGKEETRQYIVSVQNKWGCSINVVHSPIPCDISASN